MRGKSTDTTHRRAKLPVLRNSIKSTAAAVYNIYIAVGIIGVLMLILMLVDWTKWGDTGTSLGLIIKILASGALILSSFIAVIITIVAVFAEFSRSMYGKQGHLTFTLPVRASKLLASKWFAGSLWVILSYAVLFYSCVGSAFYIISHIANIVSENPVLDTITMFITNLITKICEIKGVAVPSSGLISNLFNIYAFEGGIRACVFVLTVFFAISLSHVKGFNKLGTFGRILYFLGAQAVISVISAGLTKLVKVYLIFTENQFTFSLFESDVKAAWANGAAAYNLTPIYCTVILTIFIFFATSYIIERKVNVD